MNPGFIPYSWRIVAITTRDLVDVVVAALPTDVICLVVRRYPDLSAKAAASSGVQ
jgi:hypothetical protein